MVRQTRTVRTRRAPRRITGGATSMTAIRARRRLTRARAHTYKGKFAQNVKRVLMRNAETKFVRDENISALTTFNSVITNANDFYRCFPQVSQGTLSAQRVGQRLTPVSITSRINIAFDINDALSRDIEVHVWYLNSKQQKSVLAASATVGYNITNGFILSGAAELLDNGDGTNTPFNGNFYPLRSQLIRTNGPSSNTIAYIFIRVLVHPIITKLQTTRSVMCLSRQDFRLTS